MLLPDEYFAVYAQKLSETGEKKMAWWETEKEFSRKYSASRSDVELRRFKTFRSFQVSYNRYKKGGWPESVEVRIVLSEKFQICQSATRVDFFM